MRVLLHHPGERSLGSEEQSFARQRWIRGVGRKNLIREFTRPVRTRDVALRALDLPPLCLAYGPVRLLVWGALDRMELGAAGRSWAVPVRLTLLAVRLAILVIDLLARWMANFLDAIVGDRGWLTVGSVLVLIS